MYVWCKWSYFHKVKLCQQKQNGILSSWPLFLKKIMETACVVVSVYYFILFSYTVSVAKAVL